MSGTIQRVLAVFSFALILWLTKPLPYAVSGVLSVTLLSVLGAVDSFEAAVSGFASTLVFFLFLLLLLGNSISSVRLDERIAVRLLSAKSTPKGTVRSLAANILLLSFLMPSAMARTVTFIPVVRQIADAYGLDPNSDFGRSAFLILGQVNPLASMALMTGGGMAIVASEIVRTSIRPITWVEWAIYMIPPVLALYLLSVLTVQQLHHTDDSTTIKSDCFDGEFTQSVLSDGSRSFTRDQRVVGGVMVAAICTWIIGSFVGVPTIVPAALAVGVLSLPGVQIITADDLADVSWDILFLIGTMFSFLQVMETTDTLPFIIDTITAYIPLGAFEGWQAVAVLLALAVLLRSFFSTASAAIIVVLPIVLEFGGVLDENQFYLALSVLLIIGSTTFLPFNTTAVLLSYDRGPLTIRDVFAFGLFTMMYGLAVITFSWIFYWPLIG
jgi:anion transporter